MVSRACCGSIILSHPVISCKRLVFRWPSSDDGWTNDNDNDEDNNNNNFAPCRRSQVALLACPAASGLQQGNASDKLPSVASSLARNEQTAVHSVRHASGPPANCWPNSLSGPAKAGEQNSLAFSEYFRTVLGAPARAQSSCGLGQCAQLTRAGRYRSGSGVNDAAGQASERPDTDLVTSIVVVKCQPLDREPERVYCGECIVHEQRGPGVGPFHVFSPASCSHSARISSSAFRAQTRGPCAAQTLAMCFTPHS